VTILQSAINRNLLKKERPYFKNTGGVDIAVCTLQTAVHREVVEDVTAL